MKKHKSLYFMNAEVPVEEVFINTFSQLSPLFFIFFVSLIYLLFSSEGEIAVIIGSLIIFLGFWVLVIWVVSLAMVSRYNDIRNKVIELGFTIIEIKDGKFHIIRGKEKYILKVLTSTHLHLTLISVNDATRITIESIDELVDCLSNEL